MDLKQIDLFFKPKSVAVIGASATKGKIGYEIVRSICDSGYEGNIYPVTLRTKIILGLKCYEKISYISEDIDLVIYVLPSKMAPLIIEECGKKGVKNIIIVSGGFKETNVESRDLELEVVSIAHKYGMRILGPNCIGIFDGNNKFDTFFQSNERMLRPKSGNISFITQSGTYGVAFLEMAADENVGINKMVSYGNKCDVDESDLIRYLGKDNCTKVIAIYMEAVSNGIKFIEAVREVSKDKFIVIMKGGRTKLGVEAAQSHTGWLGGSYNVTKSIFKQFGIIVAENFEEFYDIVKGLAFQPLPQGNKIGMVTNGAGLTVVACDAAETKGIIFGKYTEKTKKKLIEKLPSHALVRNIIDLTGSATSMDYKVSMEALLEDPEIDILMPAFVFQDTPLDEGILEVLPQMKKYGKPILCMYSYGSYSKKMVSQFHEQRIPFFTLADRAISAADAMIWLNNYNNSLNERFAGVTELESDKLKKGKDIIKKSKYKNILLEHEGKELLKTYDISVIDSILVNNENEAIDAAKYLDFPVVLKIVSPDIVHKSDIGAVKINLNDELSVKNAYTEISDIAHRTKSRLQGILVQKMAHPGFEVIIGGFFDKVFGPVVMFGLGGIFVEILKDVSFRLAPINKFVALKMIHEIRGYSILKGARKQLKVDEEALAEILVKVSNLINDHNEIKEIDLNPIFAFEKGASVADIRIILKK